MAKTLGKPRWEAWENICIQTAFTQNIQQKIMAAALGRSVWSISKKIKVLGLKSPSSLREQVKEKKPTLSRMEKRPQDLANMIKILKVYAPLQCFQKGYLALRNGCWTQSQLTIYSNENEEACLESIDYKDFPFSFVKPLEFTPSSEPISQEGRTKKIPGDPAYVPLHYIDQWAIAEGFHKIKGVLQHRGLSYWKDGTYFSQTQLLMHVNRLRFKYHLQPIALIEEEAESPT
jgi:hypothetical protein